MRAPAPLRRQLPPPAPALPPAGPGASLFQWAVPTGRRCRALAGAGAAGAEKRAAPAGQAGFNARLTGGAFRLGAQGGWFCRSAPLSARPGFPGAFPAPRCHPSGCGRGAERPRCVRGSRGCPSPAGGAAVVPPFASCPALSCPLPAACAGLGCRPLQSLRNQLLLAPQRP